MISTDFAPNETWKDALTSAKMLMTPWKWKQGTSIKNVLTYIETLFPGNKGALFLTARASLFHLLHSLQLQVGDEILVQGFTCEAVVLPILENKLKPIYVDIEKKTYSMDLFDLEKKITARAKVLILQHSFSFTPQYRNQIIAFAHKHHLYMIEDLAHGFQEEIINTTSNAVQNHAFLLSFGRSKFFSSVFGGCIMTSDKNILDRLQTIQKGLLYPSYVFMFRVLLYKIVAMIVKSLYDIQIGKLLHRMLFTTGLIIPEITKKEKQGSYDAFLDKAYPNGLAYLLLQQFEHFEEKQNRRKKSVATYNDILLGTNPRDICCMSFPRAEGFPSGKAGNYPENQSFICHLRAGGDPAQPEVLDPLLQGDDTYSDESVGSNDGLPLLRFPLLVENRDVLLKTASSKNIFLGKWYDQPVAPKSLDLNKVGYVHGSCPQAEYVCDHIINLPTLINSKKQQIVLSILTNCVIPVKTGYNPLYGEIQNLKCSGSPPSRG